jgi:hypothetical protein
MGNDYPGSHGRKRAIALKAADARALIQSSLPFVLPFLTSAQIGQVQKVLDAAVVNPEAQKEYADLRRKSVYETPNGRAILDQRLYDRSKKVFEEQIAVDESDKRVRLDFAKLLAPDALIPRTDNPDEAKYLNKVRNTLVSRGVWLRIGQPFVRRPDDPSAHMIDPRTFQVWLSLGPDGDAIPTPTGQLTRDALLSTTVLGANYYREVYQGSIQSTLEKALKQVEVQIADGRDLHWEWQRHRDKAKPLVVPISDALGGASFPRITMWDPPHHLVLQALELNVGGNVKDSSQIAIYAAIVTEAATRVLDTYIEDTTAGAARAVKFLRILTIAGKIAETVLIVRALLGGLIRLMATEGAAEATVETGARTIANAGKNKSPAAYYPTNYRSPPGAKFRPEFEKTLDIANRTPVTGGGGAGSLINRFDLATQQKITGWHDEFASRVKDLMAAKGETGGGWVVSKEELFQLDKEVSKKWGDIFALYD